MLLYKRRPTDDHYDIIPYRITYTIPSDYTPEEWEENEQPGDVQVGMTSMKDSLIADIKQRYGDHIEYTVERLTIPCRALPEEEEGVVITVLPQEVEDRLRQIQNIGAQKIDADPYVEFGVLPTRKRHSLMAIEIIVEREKAAMLAQTVVDLEIELLEAKGAE